MLLEGHYGVLGVPVRGGLGVLVCSWGSAVGYWGGYLPPWGVLGGCGEARRGGLGVLLGGDWGVLCPLGGYRGCWRRLFLGGEGGG